jgi:hypothetical protein
MTVGIDVDEYEESLVKLDRILKKYVEEIIVLEKKKTFF